jgi:heat shock protein HtpX
MLVTMFLLGLLYVAFVAVLVALKIPWIFILLIAGGFLFVQYFFSDKIALLSLGGREVTPQEAPELHAIVDRLCALADMPKPRVPRAVARRPPRRGGDDDRELPGDPCRVRGPLQPLRRRLRRRLRPP